MLQGYVDSISPDKLTLTGWIQVDPSGQPPALHFDRNGEVSGAAVFGHERADVVASLGVPNRVFTLSLDEPAESHHLLAKSHHVAAVVDGVRSPVQLGGRAYHQMMADFVTTASANSSGTREVILDALQVKESGLASMPGKAPLRASPATCPTWASRWACAPATTQPSWAATGTSS